MSKPTHVTPRNKKHYPTYHQILLLHKSCDIAISLFKISKRWLHIKMKIVTIAANSDDSVNRSPVFCLNIAKQMTPSIPPPK